MTPFDTSSSGYDSGAALSDFQIPEESSHTWTYSLSAPPKSAWLGRLLHEIDALRYLERNWDSYGAAPINRLSIAEAASLLSELAIPRIPAPSVVPTSDGSLQLEWHTRGIDLEIRWASATTVHVCLEDLRGVLAPIDKNFQYDFLPIKAAIRELASRS